MKRYGRYKDLFNYLGKHNRFNLTATIFIVFSILVLLSFPQSEVHAEEHSFAGGSGTVDDPYVIETAEQLDQIRENLEAHYELGANIDLANWTEDGGWDPIGEDDYFVYFSGTFDGKGHTISNLTIDRPKGRQNQGLFGAINHGGSIKNVTLKNVDVTGGAKVGGLVGHAGLYSGLIKNITISGKVHGTGIGVGGLAGVSGARIEHAHANVTVTSSAYDVGGLVGSNTNIIIYSSATGDVEADSRAGGLVGHNIHTGHADGVIAYSYATGNVSGKESLGGIVGLNGLASTVSHSYATGNVEGEHNYIGGVVGSNEGYVQNTYALGDVKGGYEVGGVVGYNAGGIGKVYWIINSYAAGKVVSTASPSSYYGDRVGGITGYNGASQIVNSYWDVMTTGQLKGSGYDQYDNESTYYGLETHQMYQQFGGWDFENVWKLNSNGYHSFQWEERVTELDGEGTKENPYKIQTIEDLEWLRNDVTSHYRLENDLDFTEIDNWLPIGTLYLPFTGYFDGNGKKIKNITIDRPNSEDLGLFGVTSNAIIENVQLENVYIKGKYLLGGLVGVASNTTIIKDVSVEAHIVGKMTHESNTKSRGVGGLVGELRDKSRVINSYSSGSLESYEQVGGLVGRIESGAAIEGSYSFSEVSGSSLLGGLVGYMSNGLIENSYARGDVSGSETSSSYVGGLVGRIYGRGINQPGVINNSYATGRVQGSSPRGLVGGAVYETFQYSSSFWDSETTGDARETSPEDDIRGVSTEEMQDRATFTTAPNDWDFDAIWNISPHINDGYPYLKWQTGEEAITLNKISFQEESYTLNIDEELEIVLEAQYSDDSTEAITKKADLEIADDQIATITENGKLTGLAKGTTTLTAHYRNEQTAVTITVQDEGEPVVEDITVNEDSIKLAVDSTFDLGEITVLAIYSDDEEVNVTDTATFEIENKDIALIDGNNIVGKKSGETVLTVSYENVTKEIAVTVHDYISPVVQTGTFQVGDVEFFIPENALREETNIYVNIVTNTSTIPLGEQQQFASQILELTKGLSNHFEEDITLTFNFNPDQYDEEAFDIAIYWLDESAGKWKQLNNISADWDEGVVRGTINHFTKFAVIATEKSPEKEDVDKEALRNTVNEANSYVEEQYTAETFSTLKTAITNAETVIANKQATQAEVDGALETLQDAIASLEEIEDPEEPTDPTVDKTALGNLVEEASDVVATDYTETSFTALTAALNDARAALENEEATQVEVDVALETLQDALASLEEIEDPEEPTDPIVDKTALEDLVEEASDVVATDYTETSVTALTDALNVARDALENEEATQVEVDVALEALQDALANLKEVGEPGKPGEDEDGDPDLEEPRHILVEYGKEYAVNANDTLVIKGDNASTTIKMPHHLPLGTKVVVQDARDWPEAASNGLLIIAGDVLDVRILGPNNEKVHGPYVLTMQYDKDNYDANEVDIYYYDEDEGTWVKQDGAVNEEEGMISIEVDHFSVYGVLADHSSLPADDQDSSDSEGEKSDKKISISGEETSKDGNTLPKTATNLFNLIALGIGLLLLGGMTLIFIRKKVL